MDDTNIASNDRNLLNEEKSPLDKKFEMEDLGEIHYCLAMAVKRDRKAKVNIPEYQAMIGSLTYALIATSPDIAAAVGALSLVMTKPGQQHFKGVKRVLRYIKGTLNYGLHFDCLWDEGFNLDGYSDADWAGDISTRKSTSGYIFR